MQERAGTLLQFCWCCTMRSIFLMFSNALSMMPCEGRLHAALATFATFANGAGRSSDAPPAALVQKVRVRSVPVSCRRQLLM